jgi:hypothetical protein
MISEIIELVTLKPPMEKSGTGALVRSAKIGRGKRLIYDKTGRLIIRSKQN